MRQVCGGARADGRGRVRGRSCRIPGRNGASGPHMARRSVRSRARDLGQGRGAAAGAGLGAAVLARRDVCGGGRDGRVPAVPAAVGAGVAALAAAPRAQGEPALNFFLSRTPNRTHNLCLPLVPRSPRWLLHCGCKAARTDTFAFLLCLLSSVLYLPSWLLRSRRWVAHALPILPPTMLCQMCCWQEAHLDPLARLIWANTASPCYRATRRRRSRP